MLRELWSKHRYFHIFSSDRTLLTPNDLFTIKLSYKTCSWSSPDFIEETLPFPRGIDIIRWDLDEYVKRSTCRAPADCDLQSWQETALPSANLPVPGTSDWFWGRVASNNPFIWYVLWTTLRRSRVPFLHLSFGQTNLITPIVLRDNLSENSGVTLSI